MTLRATVRRLVAGVVRSMAHSCHPKIMPASAPPPRGAAEVSR